MNEMNEHFCNQKTNKHADTEWDGSEKKRDKKETTNSAFFVDASF